jgi:NDP-sugar pyrophosphorylase family protein
MKAKVSLTLEKKLLDEIEGLVDGVRIRNRSQAVELLLKKSLGESRVAVIMAGGEEKDFLLEGREYRFFARLNGSSVLENIIKQLKKYGFKRIFFIARENILTEGFRILGDGSRYGVSVEYIKEADSRGTADSLKLLKGKIKTNFLVLYGDLVFDMDLNKLWDEHATNNGIATLMLESYPKPSEKGVVKLEGNSITLFVQKPRQFKSNISFCSIFASSPELLEYSGSSLEEDVFPLLVKNNMLFGHVTSGWNIHIHKKKDIEEARKLLKNK